MTKFIFKFKTPYFWHIFLIFGVKAFFPKTLALSCTTALGFLAPCKNSKKSIDPIPIRYADRWQVRRMGRTNFIGSFQLPPGV